MERLTDILEKLSRKEIDVETAKEMMNDLALNRLGEKIRLDIMREQRAGAIEVVFAENKDPEDVARILIELADKTGVALATRVKDKDVSAVEKHIPSDVLMEFNETARTIALRQKDFKPTQKGLVGVLAAGTADVPVAEEACATLEVMGCSVLKAYDVGVAGIHRVFDPLREMLDKDVDAMIVVAGMEGALPSVIAGLVDVPVIGVPTSVGYGLGAEGITALMSMLQSCSPGLAVVNIDNGFGAGVFAGLIAKRAHRNTD